MILRYGDDGCLADNGPLVNYTDYRKLEVADDAFQKKVNSVLRGLSGVPELDVAGGGSPASRNLDDAINDAIGQLEKAFSERTD